MMAGMMDYSSAEHSGGAMDETKAALKVASKVQSAVAMMVEHSVDQMGQK